MNTTTTTATTDELRSKITAIEGRQVELTAERDEIAYAAHVERDAKATKRLADIQNEIGHLAHELSTLQAAINGAGKRAAAAEAAKRDDVERENASRALVLIDSFEARGAALDAAFSAAIAEYAALSNEFRQLDAIKFSPTTFPLVKITMKLALLTKLMGTDLQVEHLAPRDRRTFVDAITSWGSTVRNRATARLNRNQTAAKRAA